MAGTVDLDVSCNFGVRRSNCNEKVFYFFNFLILYYEDMQTSQNSRQTALASCVTDVSTENNRDFNRRPD